MELVDESFVAVLTDQDKRANALHMGVFKIDGPYRYYIDVAN
jgi:hypothetical protein